MFLISLAFKFLISGLALPESEFRQHGISFLLWSCSHPIALTKTALGVITVCKSLRFEFMSPYREQSLPNQVRATRSEKLNEWVADLDVLVSEDIAGQSRVDHPIR